MLAGAVAAGLATGVLPSLASAEKVIKLGHLNNDDPFENPAGAFGRVFANIVESATNGEIKVEIFPNGQLGKDFEIAQQVRDGVIQMSLASVGGLASHYPKIGVIDVAFAFPQISSVYDVFDGPFGKALARDIETDVPEVKVLGFADTGGFFSITNSKHPVAHLDDLKGLRIRTMTLESHQTLINALGAEAYPLAWAEVYSGLQTGVIDGEMNPIPIIAFSNFEEVQKYLTLTEHLFTPYTVLMNADFYDSLTDQEKYIVNYAAKSGVVASRGIARAIEASDRGLPKLAEKMEITALSPEDREKFKEAAQPAVIELIKSKYGKSGEELLNLFLAEIDKAKQDEYMQSAP
ncbi:MAG: DctP family TRAP transporter solute-binding subunit [Geminicoccaceae bacterium]|nr:DctP family TRAP transporter solute-binding subunit [Geminicoccaceae bacterium]